MFLCCQNIELESVHSTPEKFDYAALFLRLGLSPTCTNPSGKQSFSKTLFKPKESKNADFSLTDKYEMTGSMDRKHLIRS